VVVERRFAPLVVAVVFALIVLMSRMYQVQIVEHEVWAREALNLVRTHTIEPYQRGTIYDRDGRVWVRDEVAYEVKFVWRDFRRGHPLGQVSQIRSLLEMRPVALSETAQTLADWATELVQLAPAQIDAFGRGEAVATTRLSVGAASDPGAERRWARASDLHFYVKRLLAFDRRGERALNALKSSPSWREPYLDLAARLTRTTRAERLEEVRERCMRSLDHLAALGEHLELFGANDLSGETPLARLIELIEQSRRDVEDRTADDLFAKAAGFGAWRLDAQNLSRFDLAWLRRCLFWDETRLFEWVFRRGEQWNAMVESTLAGFAIALFRVGEGDVADRIMNGLAHFFVAPALRTELLQGGRRTWRNVRELAVLPELALRLELSADAQPPASVFPFQREELRRVADGQRLIEQVVADLALRSDEDERSLASGLMSTAETRAPVWHAADLDVASSWRTRPTCCSSAASGSRSRSKNGPT